MASFKTTVPSTWTAAETFAYMADFGNLASWDPATLRSTRRSAGPLRPHEHVDVTVEIAGRTVELDYELAEYDPRGRRALLVGTNDRSTSYDRIAVADDGTVTYEATVKLNGILRLLDPLFGLVFQRMGHKAAAELERNLAAPRA